MKIARAVTLIILLAALNQAQEASIEKEFARDRGKLSLVRYDIGEDATSGSYYFVYRNRSQIRKFRVVWNGGCCDDPYARDFYFKDGNPVLYVELLGKKAQAKAVIKGSNTSLREVERLELKDSKVTMWVEKNRPVPSSDPRWKDKETSVLELFKDQLDTYQEHLKGNL